MNEGMPLVILESLALGVPVICYDIGYISEYIGCNYPGLVGELTSDALQEKINWLRGLDAAKYQNLCCLSHEIFWKNYSPSISKENILRCFK